MINSYIVLGIDVVGASTSPSLRCFLHDRFHAEELLILPSGIQPGDERQELSESDVQFLGCISKTSRRNVAHPDLLREQECTGRSNLFW